MPSVTQSHNEPSPTDIDATFRPTQNEYARQRFVSVLRNMAKTDLSSAMAKRYTDDVLPKHITREGAAPENSREIERLMKSTLEYRIYSAFRYNSQEMTYQSVIDTIERNANDAITISKSIMQNNPAGGSLTLDPTLEIPRYVSALDVHLVPGCFYREYTTDDVTQGMILAEGGKVATGANPHRQNDGGGIAKSVSLWLTKKYPDFKPLRILDIGTQSGKNLLPYLQTFPEADAHGVDVSAPALRYGHAKAEASGLPIHFSQQNAETPNFPSGTFDLIVSSFFFHELPLASTRKILKQCHRLLSPDGRMVHMELPPHSECSAWQNFVWDWDTKNNNEPNYSRFRSQDLRALCTEAGFETDKCFGLTIPGQTTFDDDKYEQFLTGTLEAPLHGRGGWFVFGAAK